MKVPRVNWKNVGKVTEPGRYMFKFGWVTVTAEDLAIWSQYPDATFALYEAPGHERLNDEYRLGSLQLTQATPSEYDTAQEIHVDNQQASSKTEEAASTIEPVAITAQFNPSEQPVLKPSPAEGATIDSAPPPSAPPPDGIFDFDPLAEPDEPTGEK